MKVLFGFLTNTVDAEGARDVFDVVWRRVIHEEHEEVEISLDALVVLEDLHV